MGDINIRASLSCCPGIKPHEVLVITRGATASINYNLFDKVYHMQNIEQMTFSFKQGRDFFYYNMVEYYKLTSDTTVVAGKNYYRRIDINLPIVSKYKFEIVENPSVESLPYLYEQYELENGKDADDNWQLDKHFTYNVGQTYEYINFCFRPDETIRFKPTCGENKVLFEVTIRLDTDASYYGLNENDSIIITPQHPIEIVDSLYSNVIGGGSGSGLFCSANLSCSNNLKGRK